MENKLSSARALHAELGVGLVRVHVHVVHSRVARYKVGWWLFKAETACMMAVLSSKNSIICYLEISNLQNGEHRLSRFISVLWYLRL